MEAKPAPRRSSLRRSLSLRALPRCPAFAALALLPLLALTAPALTAGTVHGTVVSDVTGRFAEGAEVSVDGTTINATTGRDGTFTLSGVPAGTQKLTINYPAHDAIQQSVTVGADGTVTDVRTAGQGCSISQASTSMMSAAIKGKSVDEARRLIKAFKALMSIHESKLEGGDATAATEEALEGVRLGDLEALQGVVKFPVRIKCATLAWNTLQQGLDEATGA